jgi:pilus assembly protein Flp/PilA
MEKLLSRLIKDESGAAMVEYGVLLGLIAVVCIGAITLTGTTIKAVFNNINADLTAAI